MAAGLDMDLSGRLALVGGASRGIGRASAQTLAAMGASIVAVARSRERLEDLLAGLPAGAGQRHELLVLDHDRPEDAVDAVTGTLQGRRAHVLVNNSGGPPGGPITAAGPDAFLAAFRQHLLTAQLLSCALLPGMRADGYGRIVNIVSTSVREPIAGLGVSNTIRAAVAGWAKTLAVELGPTEITVNNVLPGFTDTERLASLIEARAAAAGVSPDEEAAAMRASVPFGRFGRPEEIAALVGFLASPAAAYVSGQSIAADGARTRCI